MKFVRAAVGIMSLYGSYLLFDVAADQLARAIGEMFVDRVTAPDREEEENAA